MGTVTYVNGEAIPNVAVVLRKVESDDARTIATLDKGMFEFHDVTPGITYPLSVSAQGVAEALANLHHSFCILLVR